MNLVATRSTSAAGSMRPVQRLVIIRSMLAGLGTSSNVALPGDVVSAWIPQTSSGVQTLERQATEEALFELRRLSGLTWDQLARLFGVSRRSIHFWASGKPMNRVNEERLQRVLVAVRGVDRGSGDATRQALLSPTPDGDIPFDLLCAGELDRVLSTVGPGVSETRPTLAPLSEAARRARAPRPPDEIVGALQDRVHVEKGRRLFSKSISRPRKK